jgi:hypothetical protein
MTEGQSASLSWCQAPMGLRPYFYYCQTVAGLLMWGTLSDERMGLPFTIAAGLRQRSHSSVWVPQDSWPYFTVSDSRLPQPGGPGPHIYIPPEQDGLVIPPGTGFPFHCLLQLTGLRWRYTNPPPHGVILYCLGIDHIENTALTNNGPTLCPLLCDLLPQRGIYHTFS